MGQLCYRLVARQDWISRSRLHTDMVPLYQADISRWKRDIFKRCPSRFKTRIFDFQMTRHCVPNRLFILTPIFFWLRNIIPVVYRSMPKPKKLWQSFDINDKKEKCWWTLGILDTILLVEVQATTTTLQYEMVVYVKCCHTVLMVQTSGKPAS